MGGAGLYIHIPFCKSKCNYCDFYSFAPERGFERRYIGALVNQLASFSPMEFDSLYLGGGTPSLLAPESVSALVGAARRLHALSGQSELTLELNPGDADEAKLAALLEAGINRLSVGVQSLRGAELKSIGRRHTAGDALGALALARSAGFQNLSADLLIGLPGQTAASLLESIDGVVAAGAGHVSAYILKLMAGTPFGTEPPDGLPCDDETAQLYLEAARRLEANGLIQYEISNFARPGLESRHNLKYWNLEPYLGLGPAAASLLEGRRFQTQPDAARFVGQYGSGPVSNPLALMENEGEASAADYIMLRLRTTQGLDLNELYNKYNYEFNKQKVAFFAGCAKQSLATLSDNTLALTPKGMLVSNSIIAALI